MKLNAIKLGYAAALSFTLLWVICSLMVWLMPVMMMGMTGNMMHSDWSQMGWHLSLSGMLIGLVGWSVAAGVSGWLIAVIYNKLL